ncbi:MAG: tetratricopeptide repeat protein [Termitinemataceae bacterium]
MTVIQKKPHAQGNWKGLLVMLLLVILGIGGFFAIRAIGWNSLAQGIADLGPAEERLNTIDDIRKTIARYSDRIERHVQDAAKLANYWKILAARLMDRKLYGEAVDALEEAIRLRPEDPVLQYMYGISTSILAKSTYGKEQSELYSRAERAHKRAIELDRRYARPLYALGVLYVFELDRSEEAIPYLTRYLELQKSDVDGRFVLARAYYGTGAYQKAVDLYDEIIKLTKSPAKRSEAENNKAIVLERLYE